MKLTAKVKLQPTSEQFPLLLSTLERANEACNAASDWAWENQTFRQFSLHKALYHSIKAEFSLSSQVVVRCFAKVADAYNLDKKCKRSFRPRGGFPYDSRILSWRIKDRETAHVSIWTLNGRESIPFVCGDRDWQLLQTQSGESDLVYRDGTFYLFTTCEVEEPELQDFSEFLGVDLGVTNIAVDSDGGVYAPPKSHVNSVRHKNRRLRKKLQSKGTKSAKRRLKKRSKKEARFAEDVNHCISKRIVAKAQDTGRGVAVEELGGIRDRVTVRRHQRATHHSWSFNSLRFKIEYKAALAGVPVVPVDPRNTSRTCPNPECGHVSKSNRQSQSSFRCVVCGFAGFADHIAAINIGRRAAVNQPHAVSAKAHSPEHLTASSVL